MRRHERSKLSSTSIVAPVWPLTPRARAVPFGPVPPVVGRLVAALGIGRAFALALAASSSSSPKWNQLFFGGAALTGLTLARLSIIWLSWIDSRPGSDGRGTHCTSAVCTLLVVPATFSTAPKCVT